MESFSPKHKFLALIPARAGSKGLPGKNTKIFGNKPLIAHSIEVARQSGCFERIVVSTDGPEIERIAKEWGAEVIQRPAELASDAAAMLPVIKHALLQLSAEGWNPDYVALLQPTAPLRTVSQVKESVKLADEKLPDSVVTVVELPKHLSPDCLMKIEDGQLRFFLPEGQKIFRRQDARTAYMRDGTIYISRIKTVLEKNSIYGEISVPLLISQEESATIDTLEDWDRAERMLNNAARGSHGE